MVRAGGLDTWVVRVGTRGGTPVVFLHGIPTSAYLWREVMRAMHEEHDCIALDWPGFGSSDKPKDLDLSFEARAAHLAAVLDALGVEKAHLVGHDVGGVVALLFATEHPERVGRIALLNTTVYRRDFRPPLPALTQFVPGVREVVRPLFRRPAFEFFFKSGLARPERMPREVLENHWRLASSAKGVRSIFDTWAEFPEETRTLERVRAKLATCEGPVLVLFGADDPYLPPPNAERLAKSFPHAQLQLLPNAGHFVQEDAPEEVAERLMAFLA
jgi:pimeloyl-ACP methyl ester carboxylesterase